MKRQIQYFLKAILLFSLIIIYVPSFGQENRTFDGSGNNLLNTHFGAVGTNQLQVATNGFSDGISAVGGVDRPNPRFISNTIFNQDGLVPDVMGLSDYAWVWGQFIDHDITLVTDNPNESIDISVPTGDPYFDPSHSGTAVIGMHRSAYDPGSGTDSSNPRAFPNGISSYIDASTVYGSSLERSNWLRTFTGGKLKTSANDLLPYNTTTGEVDGPVDPAAPEMAMPFPFMTKWFVAGDIRANENPLLISFHTLFVREHNRRCEELVIENPTWTDEQIYQKVRKIIGGLIQAVVFEEWLPTLGVHLSPYADYNPNLEAGIMNVFSAAAYRYGHSVINSTLIRMDNDGEVIPEGNVLLRDAFFNPGVIHEAGGISPYLRGMATQVEQDFDCKMIHDLRNFLFGNPGSGGLDLAAMNINRGRDRGLPDYNTVRNDFGMPKVDDFASFTSNPWFNQILENVYGDINNVDAWVGFLAEDHMDDALFGESVMKIMELQFLILRNGDRFYYEIDAGLTEDEKAEIKSTHLKDIILRNSSITDLQHNVFVAKSNSTSLTEVKILPINFDVNPNPTNGIVFVNLKTSISGLGLLRVTDMLGQIIQSADIEIGIGMNTFSFELASDIPIGVYIVSLKVGNHIGHIRLLKN